jgi:hypothetical protein
LSYIPRYDKGDWIADCDVCGRKYKASVLRQRWDGLMCCPDDWEIRQPQDFVRGVPDTQIAPWLRPEPNDSFVPVTTAQWLVTWITNAASLVTTVIYAPWNMRLRSIVIATLTYARVLPSTPESINGSAINTKTLG